MQEQVIEHIFEMGLQFLQYFLSKHFGFCSRFSPISERVILFS